jgi:hypothetical protein
VDIESHIRRLAEHAIKRPASQELENDEVNPAPFIKAAAKRLWEVLVAGVACLCQQAGLAVQSGDGGLVVRIFGTKDLDGDITSNAVNRRVHLANPPVAEGVLDGVLTQLVSCLERIRVRLGGGVFVFVFVCHGALLCCGAS